MRKITVSRPIEEFNKNCSYGIYIGNEKKIELKNGEMKTIEIASTSEFISARIHWCGCKKIKFTDAAHEMSFEVRGNKFLNHWLSIFAITPLFGFSLAINYKNEILRNFGIGSLIILLAFVIATLTIWKNKWLDIKIMN
jgi:hypothetical protein